MAIPLALAAAAVTGIAGASLVSVSVLERTTGRDIAPGGSVNPDDSVLDRVADADIGQNIPWIMITAVLGAFLVLRTFVRTATQELL